MREHVVQAAKVVSAAGFCAAFLALLVLKFSWSTWSLKAFVLLAVVGALTWIAGLIVAKMAARI
jgi:hypothetical protein